MRSSVVLAIVVALWVAVASAAERDDEDTPHAKMVKDKAVCLDCHTKVPKPDEHAPNYFLVNAPSDTCLGCHSETEHPGVREHLGRDARPLPGDEKGAIACFTCHDPHPEGVIPGRKVYSTDVGERTRALASMREPSKLVEPRATLPMRGVRLRFPAAHGEGCLACHDGIRHDSRSWRERLLRDKFLSDLRPFLTGKPRR
jgi:hypothetical protein